MALAPGRRLPHRRRPPPPAEPTPSSPYAPPSTALAATFAALAEPRAADLPTPGRARLVHADDLVGKVRAVEATRPSVARLAIALGCVGGEALRAEEQLVVQRVLHGGEGRLADARAAAEARVRLAQQLVVLAELAARVQPHKVGEAARRAHRKVPTVVVLVGAGRRLAWCAGVPRSAQDAPHG